MVLHVELLLRKALLGSPEAGFEAQSFGVCAAGFVFDSIDLPLAEIDHLSKMCPVIFKPLLHRFPLGAAGRLLGVFFGQEAVELLRDDLFQFMVFSRIPSFELAQAQFTLLPHQSIVLRGFLMSCDILRVLFVSLRPSPQQGFSQAHLLQAPEPPAVTPQAYPRISGACLPCSPLVRLE